MMAAVMPPVVPAKASFRPNADWKISEKTAGIWPMFSTITASATST